MTETYRHLAGHPPAADFVEAVDQLRWDYDLEDDAAVPTWLTDAFSAAVKGRTTDIVRFDSIGSDVDSFLTEMSRLVPGWEHDDQGESIEIKLPPLGVEIYLSREALSSTGTGCSSCVVRRIPTQEKSSDEPRHTD
jgi:hypothetical protein